MSRSIVPALLALAGVLVGCDGGGPTMFPAPILRQDPRLDFTRFPSCAATVAETKTRPSRWTGLAFSTCREGQRRARDRGTGRDRRGRHVSERTHRRRRVRARDSLRRTLGARTPPRDRGGAPHLARARRTPQP